MSLRNRAIVSSSSSKSYRREAVPPLPPRCPRHSNALRLSSNSNSAVVFSIQETLTHDVVPEQALCPPALQISHPGHSSSNASRLPGPLLKAHPIAKASVIENFSQSHGLCRARPISWWVPRRAALLPPRYETTFFPGPAIPGLRERFEARASGLLG